MSPVYDCTTEEGRAEGIAKAAEAARAGEVVVLPTDTVYGVGTDAFSVDGVRSVLAAKGRGREMPPPVLVPSVRAVDGLASEVPAYARDLIQEFWPGALTLVFQAQPSLAWDLGDTNGTVAIRMPDDALSLALLEEVGPMAVTSANRTGEPAATTMVEAATQLGAAVRVYLDDGPRSGSQVSTIVDCTGDVPVVLRAGAVSQEQLDRVMEGAAQTGAAESEVADAAGDAAVGGDAGAPGEARVPTLEPDPDATTGETPDTTSRETPAPDPEPAPGQTADAAAAEPSGSDIPVAEQVDAIQLPAQQTQTAGEQSA